MSSAAKNWFQSGSWITAAVLAIVQVMVVAFIMYILAREKEILYLQYLPRIEYEKRHEEITSRMDKFEAGQIEIVRQQSVIIEKVSEANAAIKIHMQQLQQMAPKQQP